jgi:hypothetical protein
MIKFINSKAHGCLDYLVGAALIALPWVAGFADSTAATRVPVLLGVAAIVYSFVTRYELGVIRILPFRGHLMLDVVHALLLGSSPWLFHFADHVWAPHLVGGILEAAVVLCSQPFTSVAYADGGVFRA